MSLLTDILMALNVLWFGAGALYFGVATNSATKLLVSRSARQSPLFSAVFAAVRFLGGLNLGFAVLAGVLLFNRTLFPGAAQMATLTSVLALAHGTQFATNVPSALLYSSRGAPYWPVLRGSMLLIFLMDFSLMAANGVLAVFLFSI